MGAASMGEWSPETRAALKENIVSISELELLSMAVLLKIAHTHDRLPRGNQVILRNDNDSAVRAVSTGRTRSAPMLAALGVMRRVQHDAGIRVLAVHISGKQNVIADRLSRRKLAEAKVAAVTAGHDLKLQDPPKELLMWQKEVVDAGIRVHRRRQVT